MSDGNGPTGPGTNELLEVAYRFGGAVMALATGTGPLRDRLLEGWRQLSRVDGALSGLWPEPHVPIELADQIRELLVRLTAAGTIEATVAQMDDVTVTRTGQSITSLAFALQQAVGASDGREGVR